MDETRARPAMSFGVMTCFLAMGVRASPGFLLVSSSPGRDPEETSLQPNTDGSFFEGTRNPGSQELFRRHPRLSNTAVRESDQRATRPAWK